MPVRKKWLYSNAPVPDRTRRWKRRSLLKKGAQTRESKAGTDIEMDGNFAADSASSSDISGSIDVLRSDCSSSDNETQNSDIGVDAAAEDALSIHSSDFEDQIGDSHIEAMQQSAEETLPEETLPEPDDYSYWGGKAGHDAYLNTPLCSSVKTTRGDALVMCLALGLRHSLPWTAIVDILKLINSLFEADVVKATKYFFTKYMEARRGQVTYHWYCHYCHRFLGSQQDIAAEFGPCRCGRSSDCIRKKQSFFITLSLEDQLRDLLQQQEFVSALRHRFDRKKLREDAFEDLYDGELYQALSQPGQILSKWYNMSYTFNTDGFPVGGKSGKQTCWPIYIQINEVPHKMRSKYMLLAGLYVGKIDPNMQLYMHPFVEQANDLATAGVTWQLNRDVINSKVIPLCACVDTPARSKILNMTFFSGHFGCTICPNSGESTPSGLRYTLLMKTLGERTHREIILDAASAHVNRTTSKDRKTWRVKGVKGPTPLHNLHHLDLVKGVRPDIMHSIMLGNGKHHFQVLHGSAGKPYYIGSEVRMAAINQRLLRQVPPSSLPRPPRDVEKFGAWKAHEWLAWILFYAVPCLIDIIPFEYVQHISLLSSALHILMKKSISVDELEEAHLLLLRYVFLFQQYFGKQEMVINIHLLMHMRSSVLYLGPAWTHMAFGFEGANKSLLELKKRCSTIAQEMVRKYLTFKALPHLCERYASSQTTVEFCRSLSGSNLKSFCRVGDVVLVGKGKTVSLTEEEATALRKRTGVTCGEVVSFEKYFLNGIRYTSRGYNQSSKRIDSNVLINGDTKGSITKIVKVEDGVFCLVLEYKFILHHLLEGEFSKNSPFDRFIASYGEVVAVKPEEIRGQVICLHTGTDMLLCQVPYGCYGDS